MAVRAITLSALAAFGLGMLGLGAVFEEPGGDDPPRPRQPPAVAAAAEGGGIWLTGLLPPVPTGVVKAAPAPAPEPVIPPPLDAIPDDYVAPVAVWETPADWSPED